MAMSAEHGPSVGKAFAQLAMARPGGPLVAVHDSKLATGQIDLDVRRPAAVGRVIIALHDNDPVRERRQLGRNAGAHIARVHQKICADDRLGDARVEMTVGVGNKSNTHARRDYAMTAVRQSGMLGTRTQNN